MQKTIIKRAFQALAVAALLFSAPAFSETGAPKELADTADSLSFAEKEDSFKTISKGRYIAGGVFAAAPLASSPLVPCFLAVGGIGHAAQGRWLEKGWIFTAGSALSAIGIAPMVLFVHGYKPVATIDWDDRIFEYGLAFFLITNLAFKAWEIVDAWRLPSNYKIAKESPLSVQPFVYQAAGKWSHGLALNYKF